MTPAATTSTTNIIVVLIVVLYPSSSRRRRRRDEYVRYPVPLRTVLYLPYNPPPQPFPLPLPELPFLAVIRAQMTSCAVNRATLLLATLSSSPHSSMARLQTHRLLLETRLKIRHGQMLRGPWPTTWLFETLNPFSYNYCGDRGGWGRAGGDAIINYCLGGGTECGTHICLSVCSSRSLNPPPPGLVFRSRFVVVARSTSASATINSLR